MTATATPALNVASEAPAAQRGFGCLRCPNCNEEATFTVYLDTLEPFHCAECDEDIPTADVLAWLQERETEQAKWRRLLTWLDTAPAAE